MHAKKAYKTNIPQPRMDFDCPIIISSSETVGWALIVWYFMLLFSFILLFSIYGAIEYCFLATDL